MNYGWKVKQIHKPAGKVSQSQAERLNRERELREIRETHRRLREEFYARERGREMFERARAA